jgi:hypothetical protein
MTPEAIITTTDATTPSAAIMPKPMSKYAGIGNASESPLIDNGHQSIIAPATPNKEKNKQRKPHENNLEAVHLGLVVVCGSIMLYSLTS